MTDAFPTQQTTLGTPVHAVGRGVHSGSKVRMTLHPADPDSGVRFSRTDRVGRPVLACGSNVVDSTLGTTIGDGTTSVASIEHLMAAFSTAGVDNVLVELSSAEVPAMDGSARPFVELIRSAGVIPLGASRRYLRILKPLRQCSYVIVRASGSTCLVKRIRQAPQR